MYTCFAYHSEKGVPRPADSYRGFARNALRGSARWRTLPCISLWEGAVTTDRELNKFIRGAAPGGLPREPQTIHTDEAEMIWDTEGRVSTVHREEIEMGTRPSWVEGTTSYPFLAVARANNVDYGMVLSYADLLLIRERYQDPRYDEVPRYDLTWWTLAERFDENSQWASDTRTALLVEMDRQARARAAGRSQ